MSHLCSVCIHLVCDYTYFSPPSPHREGESDCDSYITNTFKEMGFFSFSFELRVSVLLGETYPTSCAVFIFDLAHTDRLSSLCVSPPHRSVQTLADKSKQEALRVDLMDALKRKQHS